MFKEVVSKCNFSRSLSCKRGAAAFTLMELVIVVVILGILATLGITRYRASYEQALSRQAVADLKLIAAAERIYRIEMGTFYPAAGVVNNVGTININLRLMLSAKDWTYNITGGADTFTATASRNGAGGYFDCVYTIRENDADGLPNPNASCPR